MQKPQKKKLLKIHIEYQSSTYPNLLCAISSCTNQELLMTKSLTHQIRATFHITNQYISSLNIKFYTAGCYEQLLEYHFCEEELFRGDSVIQRTQYYCRIRKEDIKDCIIVFDFVYQVVEELGVNKLQAKILINKNKDKKQQQKKQSYNELQSSTYNTRKFKQALGIIQCHQIAKKTTVQLAKNAIIIYLQQKRIQQQKRRQQLQRQEQQRIRLQQLLQQKKQKRKNNNISNRYIKSYNPSTKNFLACSASYMNVILTSNANIHNNTTNNFVRNQINPNTNNTNKKIPQQKQQRNKMKINQQNKTHKRITIEHTLLDHNMSLLSGASYPKKQIKWCESVKSHAKRARYQNQLQQTQQNRKQKMSASYTHKNKSYNKQNISRPIDKVADWKPCIQPITLSKKQKQRFTVGCPTNRKTTQNDNNIPYFNNFQQYSEYNMTRLINKTYNQQNFKQEDEQSINSFQNIVQKQKQEDNVNRNIQQVKKIYLKKQLNKCVKNKPKVYRFQILNNTPDNVNTIQNNISHDKYYNTARPNQRKYLSSATNKYQNQNHSRQKSIIKLHKFQIKNAVKKKSVARL